MVCIQYGNNYYTSYWLIVKLHRLIYNEYQDLGNAVPSILFSIKINDTLSYYNIITFFYVGGYSIIVV